jgi:hypothetical protein
MQGWDSAGYMIVILGVAGVALFVFGIVALERAADRKRTEAFARYAEQSGMILDPEANELASQLPPFELLNQGHSRRAQRWLRSGKGAEEAWVFDYRYVTGSGKHRQVHNFTLAAFPRMEKHLPEFQMRPENIFHKIGAALGYQDIDLPEQPEFSGRYLLRGHDEDAIRACFTHNCVSGLMSMAPICLETKLEGLLFYLPAGRVDPAALPELIEKARGVRKIFTESAGRGLKYRLT